MAANRGTHVALAALAALLLIFGVYGIIQVVSDDSPAPTSQGSSSGGGDGSTGSGGSSGGGGGGSGGSGQSGIARISGPTVDNVYPLDQSDSQGRYRADACFVLVNNDADVPVQFESVSVQGAQAQISDRPCEVRAVDDDGEPASWNIRDGAPDVKDPVNACSSGTVLEPASQAPRHGCSIRFARPDGLGAGKATLDVKVTVRCVSRSPRPCSLLGGRYAPSSEHPVTALVTTTRTMTFAPDSSASGGGTDGPDPSDSSSDDTQGPTGDPSGTTPSDSATPSEGGT